MLFWLITINIVWVILNKIKLIHLAPSDKYKTGIASYADLVDRIFFKYLSHEIDILRVDENNYLSAIDDCDSEVVVLAQIGSNEGAIFRVLLQQRIKNPGLRRFIEIHDPPYFALSYERFLEKISPWLIGRIIRRIFHLLLGGSYIKAMISPNDVFICKTVSGVESLKLGMSRYGLSVPIINIPLPNYLDSAMLLSKHIGLPSVGFFGYIHPNKGVHILVEAAILLAARKGVNFVPLIKIRGSVAAPHYLKYLDNLRLKVKISGLEEKIIFGDFIPFDELPLFISQLTAVALPYMENFRSSASGPMQWARTCGVPILAHNTIVFSENIKDGIDGKLIPIGDQEYWINVLEEIAMQPLWGDKFRAGVEQSQLESTWAVIANKFQEIL